MAYGKCVNCFWFKEKHCYMHDATTRDNGWCPDYINRKREKDTLENVIEGWKNKKIK